MTDRRGHNKFLKVQSLSSSKPYIHTAVHTLIHGMERHSARRSKGESSSALPLIPIMGDHQDEKKERKRRLWCLSCRYKLRTALERLRIHQIVRLAILIAGVVGVAQVVRSLCVGTTSSNSHHAPIAVPQSMGKTIMRDAGYAVRPRSLGYYFRDADSRSWIGTERLDPYLERPPSSRKTVEVSRHALLRQKHLLNSNDYYDGRPDYLEEGDCKAQYDWQLKTYPTCNDVHEQDLGLVANNQVLFLGNGYWRDVWKLTDAEQVNVVLKTLRYEHSFDERNVDRHRRDAVATERMTASNSVVNIYSFCGNSGIFEYANGGDMEDMIWYSDDKWNSTERLIVAFHVATAIADVHEVEGNGRPSIAHTDITTSQFVYIDGRYKLNDFNRCRFITWNQKTNEQCGFFVGNNPGHVSEYNVLGSKRSCARARCTILTLLV